VSKQPTISTIASGFYSTTALNVNFENIRDQFDNTLSLDGSTPNAMEADLDLNSNHLLNAGDIYSDRLFLNGLRVTSVEASITWQGEWATATDYVVDQLVREDGTVYICLVDHTSGTFATDLSNSYWEVFAQKGSAGAGTGDMLAANNLSDVADADTSLANLGGVTDGINIFKGTTTAQLQSDILDDLAGLTQATNKIPYFNSATTASTLSFVDEDDMASDSATAIPSQQSVKAYADSVGITQTSGSAPYYGARAFCVWDATGATGATTTQAEGNIGTLTKSGTGLWSVTFDTAMPDAHYAITYTGGGAAANDNVQTDMNVYSKSTTGFSFSLSDATNNTFIDRLNNSFVVVR